MEIWLAVFTVIKKLMLLLTKNNQNTRSNYSHLCYTWFSSTLRKLRCLSCWFICNSFTKSLITSRAHYSYWCMESTDIRHYSFCFRRIVWFRFFAPISLLDKPTRFNCLLVERIINAPIQAVLYLAWISHFMRKFFSVCTPA